MTLKRLLTVPRRLRAFTAPAIDLGRRLLSNPRAYVGAIAGLLGAAGSIAVVLGYPAAAAKLADPATAERLVQVLAAIGGLITLVSGLLPNGED